MQWHWYDMDYYTKSPRKDPQGLVDAFVHVVRGGCWDYNGRSCRSASCGFSRQGDWIRSHCIGFRVALEFYRESD
jgi:formylglycine-generating enzyme required for sulfatase activity